MKTEWTVQRIVELLERHDGAKNSWFHLYVEPEPEEGAHFVTGWINLASLCDELNARDREP